MRMIIFRFSFFCPFFAFAQCCFPLIRIVSCACIVLGRCFAASFMFTALIRFQHTISLRLTLRSILLCIFLCASFSSCFVHCRHSTNVFDFVFFISTPFFSIYYPHARCIQASISELCLLLMTHENL